LLNLSTLHTVLRFHHGLISEGKLFRTIRNSLANITLHKHTGRYGYLNV